ncbi:MAG: hypothetical protein U5R30_15155 [Deltaproteobacteria bacterium]|nr:hypothetical protein [Deltaproteobacteria bacterium]
MGRLYRHDHRYPVQVMQLYHICRLPGRHGLDVLPGIAPQDHFDDRLADS